MSKRFFGIVLLVGVVKSTIVFLISASVLLGGPSILYAKQDVTCEECKPGIAWPDQKCRVIPPDELNWSEPEKWAWKQICEDKNADFNGRQRAEKLCPEYPKPEKLDPKDRYKWSYDYEYKSSNYEWSYDYDYEWAGDYKWADGRRTLRANFLKTVLLNEPFRSVIPHRGIWITGAYFEDEIDLRDASIKRPLMIESSLFKSPVIISRLTTPKFVSFTRSRFDDKLIMNSVLIEDDLFMIEAEFKDVLIRGAKIGDTIDMKNSKFNGKFDMASVSAKGHFFMMNAEFGEVFSVAARTGGQINMSGSRFKNALNMSSVSIGADLLLRGTQFEKPANLKFLSVGSNLDVRGATLSALDLTGSRIKRGLWLGPFDNGKNVQKIQWEGYTNKNGKFQTPKLTLRDTSVGILRATKDAWPGETISSNLGTLLCTEVGTLPCIKKACTDKTKPSCLELDGFIYERLGRFSSSGKESPYDRKSKWFIEWLAKDKDYSPQPYRHLAGVLRAAGYEWRADNILYAGRAREHRESDMNWHRGVFLWVLWLVIGYGYGLRNFVALAWVLGFTIIGMTFLRRKKDIDKFLLHVKKKITQKGIPKHILFIKARSWKRTARLGFWYSLDMLLPVIRLREKHYKVGLEGWLQVYFYLHKIMGYMLIFFVIAGLSGLTD